MSAQLHCPVYLTSAKAGVNVAAAVTEAVPSRPGPDSAAAGTRTVVRALHAPPARLALQEGQGRAAVCAQELDPPLVSPSSRPLAITCARFNLTAQQLSYGPDEDEVYGVIELAQIPDVANDDDDNVRPRMPCLA